MCITLHVFFTIFFFILSQNIIFDKMYFYILFAHQQYDVATQLFIAIIWFGVYLVFFYVDTIYVRRGDVLLEQ